MVGMLELPRVGIFAVVMGPGPPNLLAPGPPIVGFYEPFPRIGI